MTELHTVGIVSTSQWARRKTWCYSMDTILLWVMQLEERSVTQRGEAAEVRAEKDKLVAATVWRLYVTEITVGV